MKRIAAVLVAWSVLIAPALAFGADEITEDDLASSRRARNAIAAELEATVGEYETAIQRTDELEAATAQLVQELSILEADLAAIGDSAAAIARELYMTGGANQLTSLFAISTLHEVSVGEQYLRFATADDVATLSRFRALRASYLDQETRLVVATSEQAQIAGELDRLATDILRRLEEAERSHADLVAAYEEQEYRKWLATSTTTTTTTTTTAPPTTTTTTTTGGPTTPTTTGPTPTTTRPPATTTTTAPPTPPPSEPPPATMTCPVDGATAFTDTWGAPRSGGRTHEGVDMIAARGTPLVAIERGTVARMSNGGLGGITLWLRGDSGDTYYYAHLDGWAEGVSTGDDVAVGELLGFVGNTGNARYTIPHLHFEHHPDGGRAVNPYPLVKGLCG